MLFQQMLKTNLKTRFFSISRNVQKLALFQFRSTSRQFSLLFLQLLYLDNIPENNYYIWKDLWPFLLYTAYCKQGPIIFVICHINIHAMLLSSLLIFCCKVSNLPCTGQNWLTQDFNLVCSSLLSCSSPSLPVVTLWSRSCCRVQRA